MLKHIILNNKRIPVPVPILNLSDALQWIDDTFVASGHTMTRISLDGRLHGQDDFDAAGSFLLSEESVLQVQIDSPIDLAVQSLEAMRNLASVVLGGIKPLAVECWQAKPIDRPEAIDATLNDLDLVMDLLNHFCGLIDATDIEAAAIQGIGNMVKRYTLSLEMAVANSDWRGAARVLLNKLEPMLKDIMAESESVQIRIMAINGHGCFSQIETG